MPTSAYDDLDRPPLSAAALTRALVVDGSPWRELRVVAETSSTNADLVAEARAGAAGGLVLVAEAQTAGRGRLDRTWSSPPRSGLTFSVLVRPGVDAARWGWLPLLCGVAVADGVRRSTGVEARLKWPNDVLAADRKLAGLLVERVNDSADPAAVVGVGLNVSSRDEELPVPTATSLRLAGASSYDRDTVLRAVLRAMAARMSAWRAADGDAVRCGLLADYSEVCDTLGRDVEVALPGDRVLEGRAQAVDDDGRLLVIADDGRHLLAAGDVVHVRRA